MGWGERFKLRIQVFTVGMAFVCPGFLLGMASDTRRQLGSYGWPEAPGVVVTTLAKPWQDDKKVTKYFGRVAYQYTVDGQDYTTDLTDLGPGLKRLDQRAALADVGRYRPGDPVAVFYDPADPSSAVLERGVPDSRKVLLGALAVGSLISAIGSVFVIRSWLRAWKGNAPPTAQDA